MKTKLWHKDFSWDGTSFHASEEIIDFAGLQYPELKGFLTEWFSDAGFIQMKTSGSTGIPKTIKLRREHMMNSAKATALYFGLEAGARALLCLPLSYIAGRMMLVRSIIMGWNLDTIEASSKPNIPKGVRYDFSAMVPLQLHHCYDLIENIGTLIVGGGEVLPENLHKISNLRTKIYATYGMTETVSHIALSPLNEAAGNENKEGLYTALPGVDLIVDKRQCLVIRAPQICSDEVVTNDIVDLISTDSFKWLARYDHVINSGGIKLFPELIEKKLHKVIHTPFFLAAFKDKILGQRLVMLVEGAKIPDLLKDLKDFQKKHSDSISLYEIPKEIYFLPSFDYTETGKIQRKLTLEQISV